MGSPRTDVGTFFDRPSPSPRLWRVPALLGAAFFAAAAWNATTTGDAFGRGFACACGVMWGCERIGEALRLRRDARRG